MAPTPLFDAVEGSRSQRRDEVDAEFHPALPDTDAELEGEDV